MLHALNGSRHADARRVKVSRHFTAVQLFVARNDRINYGNPDASADIAQQIVKSAGIADFFILQESHRGGGERNEDAAGAESADNDRPEEGPLSDGQIHLPKPDAGGAKQ